MTDSLFTSYAQEVIAYLRNLRQTLIVTRVGFFLAVRQVKRASIWTNVLIVAIMTLTFLNLIVVSGILVGLIEGAVQAINRHYLGDIFISNLKEKHYIENSPALLNTLSYLPGVKDYAARYVEGVTVESDYKQPHKLNEKKEEVPTLVTGIDPEREDRVTELSSLVIEGEYLDKDDFDEVLVGAMLLKKYLPFDSPGFPTLDKVEVGSKLRVTIGENVREVRVKGITRSKVDEIDRRLFFTDRQLRALIGRDDYNVDEVVVKLEPGVDPNVVKAALVRDGFDKRARIQTQEEAEPKFIKDIKETFNILGSVISFIGLVVASITIFIVIFINAIMRRKYIGIAKGIGIRSSSIEFAYVIQSLFYAVIGSILGLIMVFGFLEPYFRENPIDFPFSDGVLVATPEGAAWRIGVLLFFTFLSGYLPAKIVVRQNTLDAILGR